MLAQVGLKLFLLQFAVVETHLSMAVQMSLGLMPPLRRVMARFLDLFASIRDTLLGAFSATLTLSLERSVGGP